MSPEYSESKKFLKCELHVHSNISDGIDDVETLLRTAVDKGLDVISITDHDTLEGSIKAMEIVEREGLNITILPGYELSAKEGHILIFGNENIEVYDKGVSVEEIDPSDKFLAIAHPYQFYRNGSKKPEKIIEKVNGVEVFNSRTILKRYTLKAEELAKRYSKTKIAGSDAHSKDGIGYGVTLLPNLRKNEAGSRTQLKDIIRVLQEGTTQISGKKYPVRKVIWENLRKL